MTLSFTMSAADPPVLPPFESLLVPHLESAYRVAYRLTGHASDAEDLVQEAALLAWRGYRSFEPGSNFRGWLFRILTNAFYSRCRKGKREGTSVDLDDLPELYLWERATSAGIGELLEDPASALIGRLDAEAVSAAITALPEEYRVVAALYFQDDLAYREIAAIAGIPIGTVRSRLHRARRHLQRALWAIAVEDGLVPPGPSEGTT